MPEKTNHYCNQCDYKSTRKWDCDRHMRSQHKVDLINNNIPVIEKKTIQEAIQIEGESHYGPLNNIQHGLGSVVNSTTHIPIEKYNEDCNKVVRIAHGWKQECAVKDNAICVRDNFLTANNSKLQDEITKNKILIEQNRNIIEENNELVLEKENLIRDGNNKVSAMGDDMANLIHKNKILRRKSKKKNISSKYEGGGYRNKFKTKKAPTSIFVGKDNPKAPTILKTGPSGTIAPTTVYILNDRKTAYVRGENQLVGCGFDFSEISQRSKGIGGMLRGA